MEHPFFITILYRVRQIHNGQYEPGFIIREQGDRNENVQLYPYWCTDAICDNPEQAKHIARFFAHAEISKKYPTDIDMREEDIDAIAVSAERLVQNNVISEPITKKEVRLMFGQILLNELKKNKVDASNKYFHREVRRLLQKDIKNEEKHRKNLIHFEKERMKHRTEDDAYVLGY